MSRQFFLAPALEVAPQLLGAVLATEHEDGRVAVRITEVEAYHGVGASGPYDPGSHARDRRTERNASMFGTPGHAYVYLSYGIHFALNMVCSPEGSASGVLIRAGEVVEGSEIAVRRRTRGGARPIANRQLARGPGNLAQALGIERPTHDGRDLFQAPFDLRLPTITAPNIETGPRVGVSGPGGGTAFPWRFWISGDRTVSAYRPGRDVPRPT